MRERIQKELQLIQKYFPDAEVRHDGSGDWFRVPHFPLPKGWNRTETELVALAKTQYPGTAPYGIWVPIGLLFGGKQPNNYRTDISPGPPYEGRWGLFSWSVEGQWLPAAVVERGANILNWIRGASDRFEEGI